MPGMFGGGGLSASEIGGLAQQEAGINRTNTWSPIYGGTTWSQGPAGGGGGGGGQGVYGPGEGILAGHMPNGEPKWLQAQEIAGGDPRGTGMDIPGGGGGGGAWTQTQTLSPFMQQRFNLAQDLQGRVAGEMKPLDTSKLADVSMDPNFEANQQQQAYNFAKSQLDPQWNTQEQQLKSQLAAQGAHVGDPAYQTAMRQFLGGKDTAYNQAQAGSYQTGVQAGATRMNTAAQSLQAELGKQLAASGWSLGQINALLAGMPGPPGGQASPVSSLASQMQQSMMNQQLGAQAGSNILGGASMLGAAALMHSDVNAKEDFADATPAIEEFLESAAPAEYSYRPEYQGHPLAGEGRFVSPMAQGLERSQIGRQMVVETPTGKVVDYGKSFGAVLASLSHLNRKLNNVMGL